MQPHFERGTCSGAGGRGPDVPRPKGLDTRHAGGLAFTVEHGLVALSGLPVAAFWHIYAPQARGRTI